MHIKRFEAPTMLEAIQQVKAELGPDALVLSTRTLRRRSGAFGLLGRPRVEVTAAVDRDVRREANRSAEPGGPAEVGADASWGGLRVTKALVDPLECQLRELRESVDRIAEAQRDGAALARQLSALQRTTQDLARRWLPGRREPAGAQLSSRLLDAGFAPRHAFALGEEASRSAADRPERALRDALARRLDPRLVPPRDDDPARVTLFVGPTGVGKTTTLAKLAAREQRSGGDVSLVTTDTYRIGAEEQLRTFAALLHVPFGVAGSAGDLARRVEALGRRRVLVDTAGRGRREPGPLAELCRIRQRLGSRARIHLVLSATTKDADLQGEVRRYASLRPDSIVFTKLDESDGLGNVANLLLDDDVPPLAWLGTGQRVPEDLLMPDPRRLADRMLRGGV